METVESYLRDNPAKILPSSEDIAEVTKLINEMPLHKTGLGKEKTEQLCASLVKGLPLQSRPHYYGFVTGGSTPLARFADNLVTLLDQNPQSHLPAESVASVLEDRVLQWLCGLLDLSPTDFPGRVLTTGATASNILGLAVAREHLLESMTGELGLFEAQRRLGVDRLQVLSCLSHSSLGKAASVVGLGRASIIECGQSDKPWTFDLTKLEQHLKLPQTRSIVAVSCGEVNTGKFTEDIVKLRQLCDKHGAWLHVDGAFGIFARLLTEGEFADEARQWCKGVELADSITGDGHKMLNVPYDCGFFFCRYPELMSNVFRNPGAAYLAGGNATDGIQSANNIGIENSRRFRALPVFATIVAYGQDGYRQWYENMVRYSRDIAKWIDSSEDYQLLTDLNVSTIVLFREKSPRPDLKGRINAAGDIYVSGTSWQGEPAVRLAVSNFECGNGDALQHVITCLKRAVQ